jgi:type IV pilus assembly protein PilW
MFYPRRSREGGFSFINLLVSIALIAIVLSALTTTFISQTQSYDVQEQVVEMQQNVRTAMDLITREVRMAGFNPTGAAFEGVQHNTAEIHIRSDLSGNGDYNDQNEEIIYTYNGPNLRIERDAGNGKETLAENIQAFTFAYFDFDGNPTTTSADIHQLEITITARTTEVDRNYPINGGYRTASLTSLVTPRNLTY